MATLISVTCACGHTSDSTLANVFRDHKAQFETLLGMKLSDDPNVVSVSLDKIYSHDSAQLTAERWDRYRELLRRLGLARVDSDGDNKVWFRVDGPSLLNGAREKGFFYSKLQIPSSDLQNSLDSFRPASRDAHSGFSAYRRLEGNWYLYITLE